MGDLDLDNLGDFEFSLGLFGPTGDLLLFSNSTPFVISGLCDLDLLLDFWDTLEAFEWLLERDLDLIELPDAERDLCDPLFERDLLWCDPLLDRERDLEPEWKLRLLGDADGDCILFLDAFESTDGERDFDLWLGDTFVENSK